MKRSLRHRMVWTMWALSALVCLVTVLISTYLIVRDVDEESKRRIRAEQANLAALGLVDLISLNAFQEVVPRLPETLRADRLNEVIRIYAPPGVLLYSNERDPDFNRLFVDRTRVIDQGFYFIRGFHQDYLALLRSHATMGGGVLWVEIATPRRKTAAVLAEVSRPFLILFIGLLVLSFFVSRNLTRWGFKPIARMAEQVDNLDLASLKTWEPLSSPDQPVELHPVIDKVDQLLQRAQSTILRSQRMAQFVAHEVRTPLTILRGELESALENPAMPRGEAETTFRSGLEEVDRIERTIRMVLQFGRSGQREHVWQPQSVDIGGFLGEFRARHSLWAAHPLEVQLLTPRDQHLFADPGLLSILLGNLVRNIAEHTPEGTAATLAVESAGTNQVRMVLSDTGPGLSPEALAAANDEAGSDERLGVGIALCKEIASVGHLGLRFENQPGGGLTVGVLLPLGPEEPAFPAG